MKVRYIATAIMAGIAVAAVAAAPIAAAANPSTTVGAERTTTTETAGHNAIVFHPPTVSAPQSYGSLATPGLMMLFD